MKLKGLKKAIGDYKRANVGGLCSPSYGRLMLNIDSGEIWTDCFYDIGHKAYKKYNKSVVDLGEQVGSEFQEINMKTVQAYVDKHYMITEKKNVLNFSHINNLNNYLNLKTEGEKIKYNHPNYDFVETVIEEDCKIFVAKTNIPKVFVYGAIQLKDDYEHKAGYVWSSRVGVLNKCFKKDYVDVTIDNCRYAMRVGEAAKYLPEGYEYVREIRYGDEPNYKIQLKQN